MITKTNNLRGVITLITGTGLAQAIPIVTSPILTRLYSPDEFGVFALCIAIASIMSVLVTGRYELAILLPRSDRDAIHLMILSISLSCVIGSILLLFVVLLSKTLSYSFGAPEFADFLYWIPLTAISLGIFQSFSCWCNRLGNYRQLALARTLLSANAVFFQLCGAYYDAGVQGLVGGQFIGQMMATLLLAHLIVKDNKNELNGLDIKRMTVLAKKNVAFPKYMIFGQLLNVGSMQLPLFLLGMLFGPIIAGYYAIAQRALVVPLVIIGGAIGEVYRSEAAKYFKVHGNCRDLYTSALKKLFFLGIVYTAPVMLFGPEIFGEIFGGNWRTAGELAAILSVMTVFQTLCSPLSHTVLLAGKQSIDMLWQIMRFISSFVSLYVGYKFYNNYLIAIVFYSAIFSILYLIHTAFQYSIAVGCNNRTQNA